MSLVFGEVYGFVVKVWFFLLVLKDYFYVVIKKCVKIEYIVFLLVMIWYDYGKC